MSFAHLLETGSGSLGVRLEIEGLSVQFVSDEAMEQTLGDGRRRIACLPPMGQGITIEESVNLPEALLEAQGTSVQIQEVEDESIAGVLAYRHDREWYVTSTIGVADTTINLIGTGGITAGDVLHIGTEAVLVVSVAATSIIVDRAVWGTIAQTHWSNEGGIAMRSLLNRPLAVRGRRAYLYLYGEGDDPQGDGTRAWVGHVASSPRCTEAGCMWSFMLGSIADRLKTKIGGELDQPFKPRGAYYSWMSAMYVRISEYQSAAPGDFRLAGTLDADRLFTGHYETQESFASAFTAWLADLTTTNSPVALASTFRAVILDDGRWTIECIVGTGVYAITISIISEQDGATADRYVVDGDGADVVPGTFTAGMRVYPDWTLTPAGGRLIPRGYLGRSRRAEDPHLRGRFAALDRSLVWPETRIYLDRPISADWAFPVIEYMDGASRRSRTHSVVDSSVADGWIQVQNVEARDASIRALYTESVPLTVRPTRGLSVNGTLADLRDALITEGPLYCNRGTAPFLTSAELADWCPVVRAAARRPWQAQRSVILAQPVDLEELLSHEMRLLCLFPIIDSNGRIAVQSLEVMTATGVTPTQIDDEIVTVGWSTMERANQTVNRVILKTGYDPVEDEWNGPTYDTSDASSFAQDHTDRPLTIEPRTVEFRSPNTEDVVEGLLPVLHAFAYPHDFITVHVSWKLFNLHLGDLVEFSGEHLPDYNRGQRPLVRARAIVTGRRWALGEAHGQLRLLVPWISPAGYSPTARILSQSDSGGDKWALTVDPAMYAPAGRTVPELFAVGDVVRIIQYDSTSPTVRDGEVIAVNVGTSQIAVQLTASWTPGASTWELCYGPWGSVTDSQKRYAFIASADATLDGASPKTWAP